MHLHYSMFASSDRLVEICLVIVQSSSPQTFWYQDPVSWKIIFPWTGNGRDGLEIIQVHHIYCVLYFYYFQSHLRSLGIRYLRLGTPELEMRLLMRNEILLLLFSHCLTYWLHVTPWSVHTLPCPSFSPSVCSNSCPLSQWCYSTILCSVTPSLFACNFGYHQIFQPQKSISGGLLYISQTTGRGELQWWTAWMFCSLTLSPWSMTNSMSLLWRLRLFRVQAENH